MVRARQRIVAILGRCGFAFIKGVATIIFFAFFHELGKKLVAEKDLFIALASVSFFIHLLFLQVIHEITDDLGIAQGVLFAAFTVLVAEYPKLTHIVSLSACFTVLLTIMNTPQPPPEPIPAPVIPVAEVNPGAEVIPAVEVIPGAEVIPMAEAIPAAAVIPEQAVIQMPAVPRQADGNWAEHPNARWRLPRIKSTRW